MLAIKTTIFTLYIFKCSKTIENLADMIRTTWMPIKKLMFIPWQMYTILKDIFIFKTAW